MWRARSGAAGPGRSSPGVGAQHTHGAARPPAARQQRQRQSCGRHATHQPRQPSRPTVSPLT
eukprot:97027-Alexandrium_andersonii.AAC.1